MKRLSPFLIIFALLGGSLVAQTGSDDPKALFQLARRYETGDDSIAADSIKSILYYKESAMRGYPPSMNYLGFSYYNGRGVARDIDSAIYWIREAALHQDITAAANLGFLLLEGDGVVHDTIEAEKWLWSAAEGGVPGAQLKIADMKREEWNEIPMDSALSLGAKYYEGKAPVVGVKLLQVAADKGSARAMALLGDAYSKGIGVPYNHSKSIEYFNKAAQAGDPEAQSVISELLEIFPDALNFLPSDSIY